MHAVVLDQQSVTYRSDYPLSPAGTGEVPVRVTTAGICETDLQLLQGYMGFSGVLGHEFVGVAQDGPFAGLRVVGEINCSCHKCDTCRAGRPNHCPNRTVLGILNHDGAFADVVHVPQINLHPVPDRVSDDEAVFVEPLAAAFRIPMQMDLQRVERAVVLGDGRLGNLCAQVLKQSGCPVLVVGKHPSKLAVLESLGIEGRLLEQATSERTADLVVDCTGSVTGLPTACRYVRPQGTIVLKSTVAGDSGPSLAPMVIDEVTVLGSRCGPFDRALRALAQREVSVLPLITGRFPLSEAVSALQAAAAPDHLKVLLDIAET